MSVERLTALGLLLLAGCQPVGLCAKRESELNCPTDIRKTVPWCAGEDAIFRCPCGPDGEFHGHKPTCWRTWPAPAAVWRDAYCAGLVDVPSVSAERIPIEAISPSPPEPPPAAPLSAEPLPPSVAPQPKSADDRAEHSMPTNSERSVKTSPQSTGRAVASKNFKRTSLTSRQSGAYPGRIARHAHSSKARKPSPAAPNKRSEDRGRRAKAPVLPKVLATSKPALTPPRSDGSVHAAALMAPENAAPQELHRSQHIQRLKTPHRLHFVR